MRVLLADDHQLLLEGLGNLLAASGIEVVGVAHDGLEAATLAHALQPDIILMDIRMPRCDGLEATRRIKAEMPAARIVILTTSDEDADLFEAVKSAPAATCSRASMRRRWWRASNRRCRACRPSPRGWPTGCSASSSGWRRLRPKGMRRQTR